MQWRVLSPAYPNSLECMPKPEIRVGEAVDAPEKSFGEVRDVEYGPWR